MKWRCSLRISSFFLLTILLCFLHEADGKIRRRRQYTYTNYGSVGLNPEVISYYGMSGAGRFTGNGQENNQFIVGGVAYRYPTPVNVMSAGQYDPQRYNVYPSGGDAYHYDNLNNMRLPSASGWYSAMFYPRYPFIPIVSHAQRSTEKSSLIQLFLISTTFVMYVYFK